MRLANEDRRPRRWGFATKPDPRDTPYRHTPKRRKNTASWRRDGEGSSIEARKVIASALDAAGTILVKTSRKARRRRFFSRGG